MKKIFFVLVLAFAGLLANASNAKVVAPVSKTSVAKKSIELQSNMVLTNEKTSIDKNTGDCIYLGIYDVYVDGIYIGTYHVWLCFVEVEQ